MTGIISHLQLVNESAADSVTHTLARGVDSPSHTVLVVDDDPSIRFLCRVNLELDGWAVREAGTLDEARGELLEGHVGVVLLDVHVGTQSGIDYLNELRRDHPGVSVAMLTGSVGTPKLEGTRPDAVLPKPFTLEQLAETVRRLAPRTAHSAG
jgi:DNA-binding response OmpR family regulator